MTPLRKVLQALTLVAYARHKGREYVSNLSKDLEVKFIEGVDDFAAVEVFPLLPPALEAFFLTAQPWMTSTADEFLLAARILGLSEAVQVTKQGPDLKLSPAILKWRQHPTVRVFLEATTLAGISVSLQAEDLRRTWNLDVSEDDLYVFRALFADPEGLSGDGWLRYSREVGTEETALKRKLIGQPHDFVRWKLGIPVKLDSDQVIDRLVSDAYYTERLLKFEAGDNGLHLTKDELARIKMERDTMFKGLALRQKAAESKNGGSAVAVQGMMSEFMARVQLITAPQETTEVPLASDLIAENDALLAARVQVPDAAQ